MVSTNSLQRYGTTAIWSLPGKSYDGERLRSWIARKRPGKTSITKSLHEMCGEGALRSAKKVEQRLGRRNLGPYSDFDWGMINGKLSALNMVSWRGVGKSFIPENA